MLTGGFSQLIEYTGFAVVLFSGFAGVALFALVALDEFKLPHPIRLIKMDVEGAEPQVIEGAKRLLESDRPLLLTELHPTQLRRASGVSPDEFLMLIQRLRYRAEDLNGNPIARAPTDAVVSIVCVPQQR